MINLKLRLQNKVTFSALITVLITFVYEVCGICGIVPSIGEDQVLNLVAMVITFLTGLGVLVDPTTAGISDSIEAQNYTSPKEAVIFETAEDAGVAEPADRSDDSSEGEDDEEGVG